ncbi:hypothetical protein BGW80DRAFT_508231 [Lactifluus volemus]|nr:hypothetical protein BGW80DRAFT_508231 [Lactifluus volemus]
MAHALRSVGSAALNFGLVAQGAVDLYREIGCWPWDVCVGIVILQEAGGFVTGSKDVLHDGIVTEAILTGRRYLAIRGVAETPEESSIEVQERITREFTIQSRISPSTNKNKAVVHKGSEYMSLPTGDGLDGCSRVPGMLYSDSCPK